MIVETTNTPIKQKSIKKAKEDEFLENVRKYRQQFKKTLSKNKVNNLGSEKNPEEDFSPIISINTENENLAFAQLSGNDGIYTTPSRDKKNRKDVPSFQQAKQILPYNQYKEVLFRRYQEVENFLNMQQLHLSLASKDEVLNTDGNVKRKKPKLEFDNFDTILENKIISEKGDKSNSIYSPKSHESNPFKNKKKVNTTDQVSNLERSEKPLATTIGFLCKDERMICEDFRSEMEKIYQEKWVIEQQRIQEEEEELQRKLLQEQEELLAKQREQEEEEELEEEEEKMLSEEDLPVPVELSKEDFKSKSIRIKHKFKKIKPPSCNYPKYTNFGKALFIKIY